MSDPTPCSVLFDTLKRHGMAHRVTAQIVLSSRPLADGRSPQSRISDRSWVSRFIVHAPAGSLQDRYFRDFGSSAQRIMSRLHTGPRALSSEQIAAMVLDRDAHEMDRVLAACHQDAHLYRNALERLAADKAHTPGERAEALLTLFVATGCAPRMQDAVAYALDYAQRTLGMRAATPAPAPINKEQPSSAPGSAAAPAPLGLIRIQDGLVASDPYWIDPAGEPVEIGALATGPRAITNVGSDASARHATIRCDAARGWLVRDLGSTNGTVLTSGADGFERALAADEDAPLAPGDELRLGTSTVFVAVAGAPDLALAHREDSE